MTTREWAVVVFGAICSVLAIWVVLTIVLGP